MIQYNIHGEKLLIFEDKKKMGIIEFSLILFFGHFKSQSFFTGPPKFNAIILKVTTSLVLFILCAEFNWVSCFLRELVKKLLQTGDNCSFTCIDITVLVHGHSTIRVLNWIVPDYDFLILFLNL